MIKSVRYCNEICETGRRVILSDVPLQVQEKEQKKRMKQIGKRIWKDIHAYWGFGILFAMYDVITHFVFDAFCPSVIVAGLPCPGCGMTRAVFFFATGQFARGWNMNPLGILWLLLAVYFCVMRYGMGKKPKGLLQMGGIVVGGMILFYFYRMWKEFPGNPPVSYTPGNLLEHFVPGYRAWVYRVFR